MAGKLERQTYTAHLDLLTRRVGPQLILDSTSLVTEGLTNPADFKFSPKVVIRIPSTLHSPSIIGTNPSDRLDNKARSKLTALKSHDDEAWKVTVEQFSGLVFNTSKNLVRDWEQARDMTQETFLKAWLHIETFQGGSFKNWLTRIALNTSYDLLRKRKRRPSCSLEGLVESSPYCEETIISEAPWFDPEKVALKHETQERVRTAISELSPIFREPITLIYLEGVTYEEATKILGIGIGTVKSRLNRAKLILKDVLEDLDPEPVSDVSVYSTKPVHTDLQALEEQISKQPNDRLTKRKIAYILYTESIRLGEIARRLNISISTAAEYISAGRKLLA